MPATVRRLASAGEGMGGEKTRAQTETEGAHGADFETPGPPDCAHALCEYHYTSSYTFGSLRLNSATSESEMYILLMYGLLYKKK